MNTCPETLLNVSVNDGKYTVRMESGGRLHALRYGEPWRDCCGDGLIYSLAAEVEQLRGQVSAATPKTETVAAANGSQPDSVACSEWVGELEAALCKLNEAEGRFLIGSFAVGMRQLGEAKEAFEKLLEKSGAGSPND